MTKEEAIEFGNMWLQINEDCKDSSTYEFFQKATKALEEEVSWIPVSEGLPKKGGDYLTTISFDIGAEEPVREVYKGFFCELSQKWLNRDEDVIAWMPLPQVYKADKKGNTIRKGKPIEGNNESYNCENWIP